MPRKYPPELRDRAMAMRSSGVTFRQIATDLSISLDAAVRWCRHVETPAQAGEAEEERRVLRAYELGATMESMGIHFGRVKRILLRNKVSLRDSNESRRMAYELAEKMWDLRALHGKSVDEIAEDIGVTAEYVSEQLKRVSREDMPEPIEKVHRESRPFKQRVYGVSKWEQSSGW